ncbi:MAG: hypothetical protein IJQ85_05310 [Selenomonadaceae bacterium]|nr:hypothetical protein [Selenomonadaceae bacterium]
MTNKSVLAFEDFYFKAMQFQMAQHKFQDMCVRTMKEIVKKEEQLAAENAVKAALKPFLKKPETELYKAAKIFVETYEANDLVK